jgi:hypothetical protein
MATKTDITGFSLTANKAVGDTFIHTECNDIIKYLLAEKVYKSAYEMNQDLNILSTPTYASVKLTNALSGIVGRIFPIINGSTGEVEFYTKEQYRVALELPKVIAGTATVIAGITSITLAVNMPDANYVFSGVVYGNGNEAAVAFSWPDTYKTTGFDCDSSISGTLYYTLTEIL